LNTIYAFPYYFNPTINGDTEEKESDNAL